MSSGRSRIVSLTAARTGAGRVPERTMLSCWPLLTPGVAIPFRGNTGRVGANQHGTGARSRPLVRAGNGGRNQHCPQPLGRYSGRHWGGDDTSRRNTALRLTRRAPLRDGQASAAAAALRGLVGTTARGVRWLLPWLSVLAISASAAYAATVAASGAAFASDTRTIIAAGHATAKALVSEGRGGYLTPFIGDATCQGHLGGGNPTQQTPEITAPPAWCRQ
jgi:hypothetical protein